ncbi:MAG TPA: hypothetical protein VHO90_07510, partial [Bacteroidales bacterium]|nr:hypothetical protein [Bacteroidales bacterium]
MKRLVVYLLLPFFPFLTLVAQQESSPNSFVLESSFNAGYLVQNSGDVPNNEMPLFLSINPSFQTGGSEDWHQALGFPRVGFKLTLGYLGNRKELGDDSCCATRVRKG